jgi:hypothetical protein
MNHIIEPQQFTERQQATRRRYHELRDYNERKQAERMDAIIAKVCIVGLVVFAVLAFAGVV